MEPDAVEIRVLGCLIEKQRTTPDAYPLSTNAVRLACNQSTNRDPVVSYDEQTVTDALHRLGPRGWARGSSGHSFRTRKYRHLLDEALGLAPDQLAVLCVLMLRGAQTAGELKQRTARMQEFSSLDAVEETIIGLADRELLRPLELRPGQKEVRFVHLLGGDDDGAESVPSAYPALAAVPNPSEAAARLADDPAPSDFPPVVPVPAAVTGSHPVSPTDDDLRTEVAELRAEVAALRAELAALRAELGA